MIIWDGRPWLSGGANVRRASRYTFGYAATF